MRLVLRFCSSTLGQMWPDASLSTTASLPHFMQEQEWLRQQSKRAAEGVAVGSARPAKAGGGGRGGQQQQQVGRGAPSCSPRSVWPPRLT